jgi:hypothetical protein
MKYLLIACLVLMKMGVNAQETRSEEIIKTFNTKENQEDKKHFESIIEEVFLNCPQYKATENISTYESWLNRIVIYKIPVNEFPECPLLSTVGKKNKCNSDISYDLQQFNPQTFNPLKYHFQYYSAKSVFYRVDNQNYIIEIKPYK